MPHTKNSIDKADTHRRGNHTATCTCNSLTGSFRRLTIANVLKADPTRTITLRKKWSEDMTRRFKALKREIWKAIVIDDVFGLKEVKQVTMSDLIGGLPVTNAEQLLLGNAVQGELLPRQFAFSTDPEKVNGFMGWMRQRVDDGILEVTKRDGPSIVGHSEWQNMYVDSAYKKGIMRSASELAKVGIKVPGIPRLGTRSLDAVFNLPIHADRVGLLYTRAFDELKGITASLDQTISRSLAEGIAEGRNPRQMARILLNRIEKTGETLETTDKLGRTMRALPRSRTLARTETIRAHHQASINIYRSAGLEGVFVKAEWSTAGDDRVCPDCEALEDQVFTLDEIEGMIPLHPNCRCVALPYLGSALPGERVSD